MPQRAKTFDGNLEQALQASPDKLYISNGIKGNSILILDIKDQNGKSHSVQLKRTWVPIDLMLFADRESIKSSDSIRSLVRKGAIRLLDFKEADAIARTPEAVAELTRVGITCNSEFDAGVKNESGNGSGSSIDAKITDEQYYKNVINDILLMDSEVEAISKLKDIKSYYFAGEPDEVTTTLLISLLGDIKKNCENTKQFPNLLKETNETISELSK